MKQKLLILLLASALAGRLIVQWRDQQGAVPVPPPVAETGAPPAVPPELAELARLLADTAKQPGLGSAAIGFCVLDAGGEVLFGHQERTAFIPASSLKTVTTATALEKFAPDFRFETRLGATASVQVGVINGDLLLIGTGDPQLSLAQLQSAAAALKSRGLRRITGRIIGDGRLFTGSLFADFWDWGDIGNGYGSPVAGLNLEHNRYTATFRAGESVGEPAAYLGARPEVPDVQWSNEVRTGGKDSGDAVIIHGGERTGLIHLRGTVPLGAREFTVTGGVPDPERFASHHLRESLLAVGIEVVGPAVTAHELTRKAAALPESKVTLHTLSSGPLIELIRGIHATSDNHETECLFRRLGLFGLPSGMVRPEDVIRDHWRVRGLVFEGLRMEDGCGLARADFIRPLDLARLQHLAATGPHGDAYVASLLASDDGTIRFKGGAMSGIRSTTGLISLKNGQRLAFAFMANHFTDSDAVRELRDALLAAVQRL